MVFGMSGYSSFQIDARAGRITAVLSSPSIGQSDGEEGDDLQFGAVGVIVDGCSLCACDYSLIGHRFPILANLPTV